MQSPKDQNEKRPGRGRREDAGGAGASDITQLTCNRNAKGARFAVTLFEGHMDLIGSGQSWEAHWRARRGARPTR